MSAEKELRRLKQQLQDYQQENQNLQHEVKKWSQYCAYVAGASIRNHFILACVCII